MVDTLHLMVGFFTSLVVSHSSVRKRWEKGQLSCSVLLQIIENSEVRGNAVVQISEPLEPVGINARPLLIGHLAC